MSTFEQEQDQKDSLVHEIHDFPVVTNSAGIDWVSTESSNISRVMEQNNGIHISDEEADAFAEEVQKLAEKYKLPHQVEYTWKHDENGRLYLSELIADSGKALLMDLELHEERTPCKMSTHNMYETTPGLFFLEGLESYLRHSCRIQIPCIKADVVKEKTVRHKIDLGGEIRYFTNRYNILDYSFKLPSEDNLADQSVLDVSTKKLQSYSDLLELNEVIEITKEGVFLDGKKYVSILKDSNGNYFFEAQHLSSQHNTILLFHLLSRLLTRK